MARPSKYQTHVAPRFNEIADWVRNGATDADVATRLGISLDSLYTYKRQYSEFSDTLKKTRDAVDAEVENALLNKARAGDTTAMIFWLKNRRPKQWRDKPIDDNAGACNNDGIVVERRIVDLTKEGGNGDTV